MCHRGLRYCDAPAENPLKTYDKEEVLKKLKVYPEDEDGILTNWDERVRMWEDINRNGIGRVIACNWAKGAYHNITKDCC
jgi:hypothetical protein